MCGVLLLTSALQAQEQCAVEVKLLLSPQGTSTAITSLKMKKETAGEVYFFDTDALDLLSKGVIVRVRRGSSNDLTVKIRPPANQKLLEPSRQRKDFKCEVDMSGGHGSLSYSIQTAYAGSVTNTGNDIVKQLSDAQKELLKEVQVSVDWTRVKMIASIKSTDWDARGGTQFDKLTLELWEWPEGSVLELSTKVGADEGSSAYARLLRLANDSNLAVGANQRPKTNMVLEKLAHHQGQ